MTKLEKWIDEVKERCEKATKDWSHRTDGEGGFVVIHDDLNDEKHDVCYSSVTSEFDQGLDDVKFIGHSRADLPKAMKIIERMRDALKFYADDKNFRRTRFVGEGLESRLIEEYVRFAGIPIWGKAENCLKEIEEIIIK